MPCTNKQGIAGEERDLLPIRTAGDVLNVAPRMTRRVQCLHVNVAHLQYPPHTTRKGNEKFNEAVSSL